jgi:hypothetical protein
MTFITQSLRSAELFRQMTFMMETTELKKKETKNETL